MTNRRRTSLGLAISPNWNCPSPSHRPAMPTSMLDPITAAGVVAVLRERAAAGAGVLFITHDHRLLDAVADEVMELG